MSIETTIVYHLGAPHKDMDVLTWSLRKDNALLNTHAALARRPSLYRDGLTEKLLEVEIEGSTAESGASYLKKIAAKTNLKRLLLSDGSFLAPVEKTMSGGKLYANAGSAAAALNGLFPENACEFFLEIRNPATLIPTLMALANETDFAKFLNGADPLDMLWSEVIQDIHEAAPGCKITVWQFENRTADWPDVLRAVSGVSKRHPMIGDLDQAERTMSEQAFKRIQKFLADRPELNHAQKRRIIAAFQDADADHRADSVEALWSEAITQDINAEYTADIARLEAFEGVELL